MSHQHEPTNCINRCRPNCDAACGGKDKTRFVQDANYHPTKTATDSNGSRTATDPKGSAVSADLLGSCNSTTTSFQQRHHGRSSAACLSVEHLQTLILPVTNNKRWTNNMIWREGSAIGSCSGDPGSLVRGLAGTGLVVPASGACGWCFSKMATQRKVCTRNQHYRCAIQNGWT